VNPLRQKKILDGLKKRAIKAGVRKEIECRQATEASLSIDEIQEEIDFCFARAVVHEIPDKLRLFEEIRSAMKPAGTMLMADPSSHFSQEAFERAISTAENVGFLGQAGAENLEEPQRTADPHLLTNGYIVSWFFTHVSTLPIPA
jgi:SAM-dependent methyltransferase